LLEVKQPSTECIWSLFHRWSKYWVYSDLSFTDGLMV